MVDRDGRRRPIVFDPVTCSRNAVDSTTCRASARLRNISSSVGTAVSLDDDPILGSTRIEIEDSNRGDCRAVTKNLAPPAMTPQSAISAAWREMACHTVVPCVSPGDVFQGGGPAYPRTPGDGATSCEASTRAGVKSLIAIACAGSTLTSPRSSLTVTDVKRRGRRRLGGQDNVCLPTRQAACLRARKNWRTSD